MHAGARRQSDLVSTVTLRASSINNSAFDTHAANGVTVHASHLRIAFEMIGRRVAEMSLTPSRTNPSQSLGLLHPRRLRRLRRGREDLSRTVTRACLINVPRLNAVWRGRR
ncbi:hypothetical protein LXT21_15065 [Myxococcus sp. K38C18041901]|uniref:hypothetical protein n=1 Tax=Myxococcus guangdongensis TaxID=2906760 RepID=UPI0020A7D98A|nr:hypothetical protein [Myxococcus guangdongensis]MCP3060102.1 hypothetical protein [Myxococcus guangdongensis]